MATVLDDIRSGGGTPTLPELLRRRGQRQPDDTAYVFLYNGEDPRESLTYRELADAVDVRARWFAARGMSGQSAVLIYPSGLEFVRTLLGCMASKVTAAPVQTPRHLKDVERIRRIARDAGATTVLTETSARLELEDRFGNLEDLLGLTVLDTDDPAAARDDVPGSVLRGPAPGPDDVALLQYTSGSTGDPKGVVVTHANFLANVTETDALWPCAPEGTVVNWLPLFHDMGMLFGVVMPLWAGIPSYLMAPAAFIRRPARWLEAIARFRGTHSAAPSFAYEMCARVAAEGKAGGVGDLSSWRVAANGAEPVRWRAIRDFTEAFVPHGFRPEAMCPGYGLAENTLKVTGSDQDREPTAVWLSATALREGRAEIVDARTPGAVPVTSSGRTVPGTEVRIVDPGTSRGCPPDVIGEIWVNGPCVAAEYRGRPEASAETFRARLRDADGRPEDGRTYLRTGDLGFLHDGELHVAGRFKDLIIHQGRNYYPQDVELSAEKSVDGLHPNCAVAFAVERDEKEHLVLVVEADGRTVRAHGTESLRARVVRAVHDHHHLTVDTVLVVRRGAIPKTSSGKVQRRACRALYEGGDLTDLAAPSPGR
ncbi:Putative Acyl-CoA synthetase [Streptomyces ambofaciens ATCC 23877]|uniref:Putative Acyl-CoA synthetase n=1 Tax=Streptomyces ambofaciens (strain ATCC 23877 / 3486 / DSM 40053 / JCM 4204 / NBRC 12836 / NRRL B-2516) TaxID=278992 RepID=A0ACI8_STRA7|nr:fatty acyl-AMP ligase [Streptomyces ambofaciens]AKZ60152.1 Putative Acyl-CoA synthetase [Streptomyces ambofaciens ATCC 23877]CAJ88192.1 putative peptide synthetase NRPS5-4-3 [Streptomyces ambofaciens ATCC 23877]